MTRYKFKAINFAAANAVKTTAANHCPLAEIAAGAVRGTITGARELGWRDAQDSAAAMVGVMHTSIKIL